MESVLQENIKAKPPGELPIKISLYRYIAFSAIVVILGIVHAISLSFVNDDAFISFRYAKNFVNGLGLVFNAGERVEGYTNFLWTIIMALGIKLGVDPVPFSTSLGIVFYLLNLLNFIFLSFKFRPKEDEQTFFIPLTALILSVHRDFNAYATSGLETSMFTFFVSASFTSILFVKSPRSFFISGLSLTLVMLTRPDGVIFCIAALIYLILTQRRYLKNILFFFIPIIIIFAPYWLWRYGYYGYIFPNTFYAKSINLPYYNQGLNFVLLYLKVYYGLLLLPLLIGFVLIRKFKKNKFSALWLNMKELSDAPKPILLAGIFIISYTFFIIRIGGDFMHARLLIPLTPLLFFIFELLLNRFVDKAARFILSFFLVITVIFRNDIFEKELNVGYVVDEVKYYTYDHHKKLKTTGELLQKYLNDLRIKIAFWGSQARVVYYSDVSFAIEAQGGLTDTALAHQTIKERGRPGHEKSASLDYLQKRGIHFFISPVDPAPKGEHPSLNFIQFDSTFAQIITYEDRIMSTLAKYPEAKFVRIPEFLDAYIKKIGQVPAWKVEQDYTFLKDFYFKPNNDTLREKAFLALLSPKDDQNLR